MEKMKSFVAAFLLFIIFSLIVGMACVNQTLETDHETFRFWYDSNKDMSYDALADNMRQSTVLLMGSSEFHHGIKSAYHPRNMFAGTDIDVMTIGGAWNQTLFHTIALGALEPKLTSRKAVLLISPTWFKRKGVKPEEYAFRFSETEYYNFMKNDSIPDDIKKYVAKRTETLLRKYPDKAAGVHLINHVLLQKQKSPMSSAMLRLRYSMVRGKDHAAVEMALRARKIRENGKRSVKEAGARPGVPVTGQEWSKLYDEAVRKSVRHSDNPFFMLDKKWKRKYRKIYRYGKIRFSQRINAGSPEFDDLKAFLDICRTRGIETKLIILPVNGRWYDHIGTMKEDREETARKIMQMAAEHGAEAADLTQYEYDEFMTRDAVHPWGAGWVMIDEEIYNFCKKQKTEGAAG